MSSNEGVEAEEVPDCPLCGGRGNVLHEALRDRYFGARGRWSFLRCHDCHHAWLNPRPNPSEVAKLYPSYWDSHSASFTSREVNPAMSVLSDLYGRANRAALAALGYDTENATRPELLLGTILLSFPPLKEILEGEVMSIPGPARGRLLDIGCGDGSFMKRMGSFGWQVEGIDRDPTAVSIAREQKGLSVTEASVGDAHLLQSSYDAITMSHVIEHLWEPTQDLTAVRGWLKPGGALVIRTPNLDSRAHRVFRASWMHLDPPRHIHLFTPRTLRECVERGGFVVEEVHTSARGAQGVFDSSKEIQTTGRGEKTMKSLRRSARSRLFLVTEIIICMVEREAGEEIVLIATRGPD